MVVEKGERGIVVLPARVVELETYPDEQIAQWVEADRLDPAERAELLRLLTMHT